MARGPKPGTCNNPAGRPPGIPNKVYGELRTLVRDFITESWQDVPAKYAKLEPSQQLAFLEKLLPYALPRLKESEMKIDFSTLTDAQLDAIVDKLMNNGNE